MIAVASAFVVRFALRVQDSRCCHIVPVKPNHRIVCPCVLLGGQRSYLHRTRRCFCGTSRKKSARNRSERPSDPSGSTRTTTKPETGTETETSTVTRRSASERNGRRTTNRASRRRSGGESDHRRILPPVLIRAPRLAPAPARAPAPMAMTRTTARGGAVGSAKRTVPQTITVDPSGRSRAVETQTAEPWTRWPPNPSSHNLRRNSKRGRQNRWTKRSHVTYRGTVCVPCRHRQLTREPSLPCTAHASLHGTSR